MTDADPNARAEAAVLKWGPTEITIRHRAEEEFPGFGWAVGFAGAGDYWANLERPSFGEPTPRYYYRSVDPFWALALAMEAAAADGHLKPVPPPPPPPESES